MRPVPKKPPTIGQGAEPGYEHPLFKTVGPTSVTAHYSSGIDTGDPIGHSLRQTIAAVKAPTMQFGNSATAQTRNAFARSMQDTSKNAILRSEDEFRTKYQSQAEEARSQDIKGQRENATDRFRMDSQKSIFDTDTLTGWTQDIEDIYNRGQRARSAAQAQITAAFLRMLGGLL